MQGNADDDAPRCRRRPDTDEHTASSRPVKILISWQSGNGRRRSKINVRNQYGLQTVRGSWWAGASAGADRAQHKSGLLLGMRVLHKQLEPDGEGSIKMQADTSEDMWHLYNLLAHDDKVTSVTTRKVQNVSATGSTTSAKVTMKITLSVEDIDYDPTGHTIRIKGKNLQENKFVKVGQYHTVELGINRPVSLWKPCWDAIYLDRLHMASDASATAEAAVILMQPGLAHVNLITSHMTSTVARIETAIPKKRVGSTTRHDKGVARFYDNVVNAIVAKIRFDIVKCVIVGSPGFLKDDFLTYMFDQAVKRDLKVLLANKAKFRGVGCSSAHMQSLKEVLTDPGVAQLIENTKAIDEVKALDDFYAMLNVDPNRAFYGYDHVLQASNEQAIEALLVTDELFRSADVAERQRYVDLVERTKDNNGHVFIFSTQHPSGQQLKELTGIAALLRFPIHVESDHETVSSSSSSSDTDDNPQQ